LAYARSAVLAAIGGGLCVAVGTQQLEITQLVVGRVPVTMLELERDGLPEPDGSVTLVAPRGEDTFPDQAQLQVVGADRKSVRKIVIEWTSQSPNLPPAPGLTSEMGSVQPGPLNGSTDRGVVAACGPQPKTPHHLG